MVPRQLLAATSAMLVLGLSTPPAAADTPQRHLVFSVHEDQTTRTRTRQETDVNTSFNGTGANVGMGGGVNTAVQGNVVDTQLTVDVMLVTPDGALGCDVKLADGAPAQRVWIGRDGTVRATGTATLDPAIVLLLGFLATHIVPDGAEIGGSWDRGQTRFTIASLNEPVARIEIAAQFGVSAARGISENGWADYDPGRLVPTRADVTLVQRDQTATQSLERRRHLTIALVTDSRAAR